MRMITRCPSCGTAFRVYAEQLAARDGQVRCGHCATVFDARAALASEPDGMGPPSILGPPSRIQEIARVEAAVSRSFAQSPEETGEISLAEPEGDFGFGHQRESTRGITIAWTTGIVTLSLALAAQLAYGYRAEIIAAAPPLRSWYEAACRRFGCEVPLARYANLISIESSELAAERGVSGLFTLAAVLRNRAGFVQAHPALELTLTDAQDRPIVRRVLLPRDYLDTATARESGFAANSEHIVKVHIDAGDWGATGYRLYAFYE